MLVVGLTGNIASGKSTVARLLGAHGATVIDADELAREVVEPGTPALSAIVARWGSGVLDANGHLDRAALRHIVFEDAAELEALNAIVHPAVAARRHGALAAARTRGDRVVVCDIPLLFEGNLTDSVDTIVLVDAPRELRLERLVDSRALSDVDAMSMIAAQMPSELKRARADHVIDNAGSREALADRVAEVWRALAADPRANTARA